jgi:acetolactate synthase-1/2/3 large subunit
MSFDWKRFVTAGASVVSALASEGVDVVFGIPGTHSLELYRELPAAGIFHVTTRHEQGAAFAADGYARASGRPGVVVTTSGPGLLNAATGLATAYADSIPVLAISPGPATGWTDGADTGSLHELKNQQRALDSIVERSLRVTSAAEAAATIAETFACWRTSRPRPVHIEIPIDLLASATTLGTGNLGAVSREATPQPDDSTVREVAALLSSALTPAIVAGGGCVRATAALKALAERLGAPVLTTLNGKGVLDEFHPLSLGSSARIRAAQDFIRDCDVVLVVGATLGEAELWGGGIEPSKALIRIDIDGRQLAKNAIARVAIAGDAAATLSLLVRRVAPSQSRLARGIARAAAVRPELVAAAQANAAPWASLHRVLAEVLPRDAIIAGDSSQVSYHGTASLWRVRRPRQFLFPAGFAPLGYGVPAAIGCKLAFPNRAVIALIGDGAFVFSAQELLTAADLGLGIPILVANNRGFGEIRDQMDVRAISRIGVDLDPPEVPALAQAYRCEGRRVTDGDELRHELSAALRRRTPTVLEIDSFASRL